MYKKHLPTLLAIGDGEYLDHLRILAASIHRNFRECRIHFHLINIESSKAAELRQIHSESSFSFENTAFNTEKEKRAYCANVRPRIILNLLKAETDLVLYLDADSIVRKSLCDLVSKIRRHDIAILHRAQTGDERIRFATGVVGIKNTKNSLSFVCEWAELVEKNIYVWYSDQLCFSHTYDALKNKIDLVNLPAQFIDWSFSFATPIWTGKGQRKYSEKFYLLEQQYYRRFMERKNAIPILFKIYKVRLNSLMSRLKKSLFKHVVSPTRLKSQIK